VRRSDSAREQQCRSSGQQCHAMKNDQNDSEFCRQHAQRMKVFMKYYHEKVSATRTSGFCWGSVISNKTTRELHKNTNCSN
jgi:hypothetical protein